MVSMNLVVAVKMGKVGQSLVHVRMTKKKENRI